MSNLTEFFSWLFSTITIFLSSEPIIYLMGALLLIIIIKAFKVLINIKY